MYAVCRNKLRLNDKTHRLGGKHDDRYLKYQTNRRNSFFFLTKMCIRVQLYCKKKKPKLVDPATRVNVVTVARKDTNSTNGLRSKNKNKLRRPLFYCGKRTRRKILSSRRRQRRNDLHTSSKVNLNRKL